MTPKAQEDVTIEQQIAWLQNAIRVSEGNNGNNDVVLGNCEADAILASLRRLAAAEKDAARNSNAHATLLKICEMDDKPEVFSYDFEAAVWHWRLPEDDAGSAYGTDGYRPTTATDFYEAVEGLGKRFAIDSARST